MLNKPLSSALNTTITHLRRLDRLGIKTVRDFFQYFPRAYVDAREIRRISQLQINGINTTQGQIKSLYGRKARSGKFFIRAVIADETGSLEIFWFNQPHLLRMLKKGTWIIVSGKLKVSKNERTSMVSPRFEEAKEEQLHTARIVPVYPETGLSVGLDKKPEKMPRGKISSKWIREKLHPLLPYAEYFQEFLPETILKEEGFVKYSDAIRQIHFPENEREIENARLRLGFDEMFLLQLAALKRKADWQTIAAEQKKQIPFDVELVKNFLRKLPFELTKAQKISLKEILDDLQKPYPMSRLLQGDVGSGKTIVAAIASLATVKAGFQTCIMAPTEILAKQHYQTFMKYLQPEGFNIQFIAGSTPDSQKENIINQMKTGRVDIVIGTHALIQEKIGFQKLGLAIIDEQHRFGVKQREQLKSYGSPHLLSLSATPIPRTLALTIYGDQDLSIIDEMPPGRQEIITRIVPEKKRREAYLWIEDQVRKGRQIFIICPLIDDSEILEVKAVTEEFKRLQNEIFKDLKLGLLHGRLKQKEKDSVMEKFSQNKINILVSTSVVEVGIDVPNATIIIIEGAERFGLSQLHQFRGRVGRGEYQSYCFLFPTVEAEEAMKRLDALVKHSNGFTLAEIDLSLRGPGEVYGIRQSGIPDLRLASFSDYATIKKARTYAEKILVEDSSLKKFPALKEKIQNMENISVDY